MYIQCVCVCVCVFVLGTHITGGGGGGNSIWRRPPTSFNGTLGRFLIYNAKFKGGLKQSANFFDFYNTPFYIL